MDSPPLDALDAGLRIARAFEAFAVPYAIGGALAYGQYGVPRATNDVDVNVFVDSDRLDDVVAALRSVGVAVDDSAARSAAELEGLIVLYYEWFRIDVFMPSIDFSWEAARTRVCHRIDGEAVWFLSAEALCVFKLMFFRGKDVVDLERLIAVSGGDVDLAYVRAQIVSILGEEDSRVETWDRICASFGAI